MTSKRRALVVTVVAAVALLAAGCGSSSGASSPSTSYEGVHRPEPLDVSTVSVTDARDGSPVPITPAAGDVTVVYFGYTNCPDVCPTTLSDLRVALGQLGDDASRVNTVFVTADPKRDTAEKLDAYVGSFIDSPYYVVRIDDPARLAAVEAPFQAQSSVSPEKPDGSYDVSHTAWTYAVGPDGKVQVEWAFGTTPDAFAHDLRTLLDQEGA
jgi:protein SCO1/2